MDERYLAYELAAAGKMVRQLISHGANVNTADAYGRTPLLMAAITRAIPCLILSIQRKDNWSGS